MMALWDLELLPSIESFFESDLKSNHTWLNPPSSLLGSYLSHYLLCKQSFPHDISACILVPHCSLSKLACRGLLRGMQELHTHFGTASVDGPPQLKAKAHVYFDPPMPRILAALYFSQSLQFITQAKVGGFPLRLLFDTGASDNFFNSATARRLGFAAAPLSSQQRCIYADGSSTLIEDSLSLSVKLHDKFFSLTFMVASLAEDFDIVIGELWLTSHRATWDFAQGILVLKNADLSVHLSMPLRSDHQAERATSKSSPCKPQANPCCSRDFDSC